MGILDAPTPLSRFAAAGPPVGSRVVQPPKSMTATMQTGHGWTATNGVTGTNLNDTSDPGIGSQSLTLVAGTTSAHLTSPALTAVDTTGKDVNVLVWIDNMTNLADLRFYLGDAALANYRQWTLQPVDDTGGVTSYMKAQGQWMWLRLPISQGTATGTFPATAVAAYRLRAQANSGTVKVRLGAVAYTPQTSVFPNGVVSFTYDDSRLSGLTYGRNRLDLYGWAGTAFLIRDRLGLSSYATATQFKAARDQSGWEIGLHADVMADHDLTNGFVDLSTAAFEAELLTQKQWFYDNGFGVINGFAWPQGKSTKALEDVAARHVSYARGVYGPLNARETFPPANPMRIRANSIGSAHLLSTLQDHADSTKANKGWFIFNFHEVVASGASTTLQANQSVHDGIIDYVASLGMDVMPMSDVLRLSIGI